MRGANHLLASSSLEASGPSSKVKSFSYKPIIPNNSYVGTLEPAKDLSEESLWCDSSGQALAPPSLCSTPGVSSLTKRPGEGLEHSDVTFPFDLGGDN